MTKKKKAPLQGTSTFPTLESQIRIKKLAIYNWSASNPNSFEHGLNAEISLGSKASQASDVRAKGAQPIYECSKIWKKKRNLSWVWQCKPLILAFRNQRQEDCSNTVYTLEVPGQLSNPVSKNKEKKTEGRKWNGGREGGETERQTQKEAERQRKAETDRQTVT